MIDVLVPYAADALTAPAGLDVHMWDGETEPPAQEILDRLIYYVLPYRFADGDLELIAKMPRLTTVQTLTAGVEHVTPYLRPGLTLCNARGVHDASTAELAVALILASLRGIPSFVRSQDRGQWDEGWHWHDSLADKTVLVVGYGSIGHAIEARLTPFECDVLKVARTARDGVAGFESLPDLLGRADVVVLICPLTDETRGMVDAAFLASMRDGSLLVNVARGAIVQTDALTAEVSTGRIRAALDVTDPEPLPSGHPLWSAPGTLISPHVGGSSTAFEPRARRLVQAQLQRLAAGEQLVNVVADPTSQRS